VKSFGKIGKKSELNSEMKWKIGKKNSEKIWKIQKKIVKRYCKYERNAS
jgi:hypothetical protein